MVTNWLITGGCGFIGTSLIQSILDLNPEANIRVFDNLTVGTREDLSEVCVFAEKSNSELDASPKGVELVVGDIRDAEQSEQAAKGVNCIVHLAANTGVGPSVEDPRLDMESNVMGVFNVLEAARLNGVERFVFASSGAPIGDLPVPPIHEELAPHPVSPYGASKLAGEGYCSAYSKSFGINTVALRFGNVYGPRSKNKASVVAKFIKQSIAGIACEIYGDGTQTRDYINISDLIAAILKASEVENVGGETFQIASGREVSLQELSVELDKALTKYGVQMEIFNGNYRTGDVLRNFSDTTKAKERLGWESKVNLQDGLDKTVAYFISGK